MTTLFDAFESPSLRTANRIVMAPMTRARASTSGLPSRSTELYYAQRASAGLIISEGIQPSLQGQSNPSTPGLAEDGQVTAWKPITAAVHNRGGKIFAQIMHGGRVGHPDVAGFRPVAPSAVAPEIEVFTGKGMQVPPVPHALTLEEVADQITAYADASRRAIAAGFDGVELHGANGYLIQQFLSSNSNLRADQYGGSVENRIRFAQEAVQAATDAVGADKVAIRLSPGSPIWDIEETDVHEMYTTLLTSLSNKGLAYVHLTTTGGERTVKELMPAWKGTLIVNPTNTDDPERPANSSDAQRWLDNGADLVSLGRHFIANPDLVERLQRNLPLAEADPTSMYGGNDDGYITYPIYAH